MNSTKKEGKILGWIPRAKYGFIVCKEDIHLVHYFLHYHQIIICEPDEIEADQFVRFEIDLKRPPATGRYWSAKNVEVYKTNPALTTAAKSSAAASTTSVEGSAS